MSTDTVESHGKFRAELSLPFPLLADTQGELSAMYDALMEHEGKKYSARKLVLIDKRGIIVYRDEGLAVGDDDDWARLLAAVESL